MYPDALTMHTDEIRQLFGEVAAFLAANRGPASRYFRVLRWRNGTTSPKASYTNGYQPQPWLQKAFDSAIASGTGLDLVNEHGRAPSVLSRAIRSTDTRGNVVQRWKDVDAPALIPVNIDNLRLLQDKWDYLLRLESKRQELSAILDRYALNERAVRIARQQTQILIAQAQGKRHPGTLPIQYVLHESGRLYAEGLNLQSCKREIRQAALAGCWDIDISTCHFAIMSQLAKRFGMSCTAIEDYAMRKRYWRDTIANDVGITQKLAKKSVTALGYGAHRSTSPYTEIAAQLGTQRAAAFFKHPLAAALKEDIDAATRLILARHPTRNDKLINLANRAFARSTDEGKKVKGSALMAHILQGVEAAALEAAVRACSGKALLLQHDGFSATEFIEPGRLREAVLESTGYDLNFEVEQIEMPLQTLEVPIESFNKKLQDPQKPNNHAGLEPFWPVLSGTLAFSPSDVPPVYPLPLPPAAF